MKQIKLFVLILLIIPSFYQIGLVSKVSALDIGISKIPGFDFSSLTNAGQDPSENGSNDSTDSTKEEDFPVTSGYTDAPSTVSSTADVQPGEEIPNQYIVVLKDDDVSTSEVLFEGSGLLKSESVEIIQEYDTALNGFAVKVPNDAVIEEIKNNPNVDYVEQDVMVEGTAQSLPTGINRVDADLSSAKSGDGSGSVDVDIAIIDSGIDLDHPDLNVFRQQSFITGTPTADDDNGHGTHVAGTTAAKDNADRVVGVAPDARLWAVKVLAASNSGPLSSVIAGVDYVTEHADDIEVANMSLGFVGVSVALDTAINNSIQAGVVYVVAAGNNGEDASNFSPANNPNVIAVSAIADSDGKCGSNGPDTSRGADDTLASFSNFGEVVDIAAPGVDILSTWNDGGTNTISGTSMASPHVAGAAALYLTENPNSSPSEVKNALLSQGSTSSTTCNEEGHGYFTGDKDTFEEPLLYLGPSPSSNPTPPFEGILGSGNNLNIQVQKNSGNNVGAQSGFGGTYSDSPILQDQSTKQDSHVVS